MESDIDIKNSLREESLRIKGLAISLGSYAILSSEKAKTIPGVELSRESLEKETAKLVNGLYINSTSIAAENEDPTTAAVMSILNLVHMYNLDLSTVNTLILATETPNDISKNNAIEVIRIINELGFKFNPKIAQHVQSACTSGVTALANFAMNGLKGRAIIVTTDDAKYRYGTNADETGGFGSTATLLEYSSEKGGIKVSSTIGHDRADVDDFTKRVEDVIDETSGIGLVNKYPAVYGKYSEYEYMLRVYRSIKELVGSKEASAGNFAERYMIISHIPFPSMPEKAVAYFVRHLMRSNEKLRAEIYSDKAMEGVKEQFLDGFTDLETQFDFISRFAGLYYKLDLLRETRDRLRLKEESGRDLKRFEARFAKESPLIAKSLRAALKSTEKEFKLSEDWKGILSHLDAEIEELEKNKKDASIDAFIKAFSEGISAIDKFMDVDSAYIRQLRKTAAFKRIMKELHINEAIEVSKETGNIYTGSAFEGLISFIWNVHKATEAVKAGNATEEQKKLVEDIYKKHVIFVGFGSGDESYSTLLKAEDISAIGKAVARNVEHELQKRRFITKEEYERLRKGESASSGSDRLMRYHGFTNAAEIKDWLAESLRKIYEEIKASSKEESLKLKS